MFDWKSVMSSFLIWVFFKYSCTYNETMPRLILLCLCASYGFLFFEFLWGLLSRVIYFCFVNSSQLLRICLPHCICFPNESFGWKDTKDNLKSESHSQINVLVGVIFLKMVSRPSNSRFLSGKFTGLVKIFLSLKRYNTLFWAASFSHF